MANKNASTLATILKAHIPEHAIAFCVDLWERYPFSFKVTKSRVTKLGDYRFNPRGPIHTITVNHDLNAYAFLITYLHEVAHRIVRDTHPRAAPHGIEWKSQFQELLTEVLAFSPFPEDILPEVLEYIANPKASSSSNQKLVKALRMYDDVVSLTLSEIPEGDQFRFRGKVYLKEKKRRTRSLCVELATGKKYLISEAAEIERLQG